MHFLGGPLVKTPCLQCRRHGFDPWSGNYGPTCCTEQLKEFFFFKEKKNEKKKNEVVGEHLTTLPNLCLGVPVFSARKRSLGA